MTLILAPLTWMAARLLGVATFLVRAWPTVGRGLLAAALLLVILVVGGPSVEAAEVLQVRSATLLQIGDRNRSYPVRLACVTVAAQDQEQAQQWLRARLPRQTRVNLRPIGAENGTLVARVTPLSRAGLPTASSDPVGVDLSAGLIAAQLASPAQGSSC